MRWRSFVAIWAGAVALVVACTDRTGGDSPDGGIDAGAGVDAAGTKSDAATSQDDAATTPTDAGADAADAALTPAATPTVSPPSGTFSGDFCVYISTTTPNATIHYTMDGSDPTTASPVYSAPFIVHYTTQVRALAVAPGFAPSAIGNALYTVNIPPGNVAPVTFTPNSGAFPSPLDVSLSTINPQSFICYTLDGAPPTCGIDAGGPPSAAACGDAGLYYPPDPPWEGFCTGTATKYVAGTPLHLTAPPSSVTVKALACSYGNNDSDVTVATYTLSP